MIVASMDKNGHHSLSLELHEVDLPSVLPYDFSIRGVRVLDRSWSAPPANPLGLNHGHFLERVAEHSPAAMYLHFPVVLGLLHVLLRMTVGWRYYGLMVGVIKSDGPRPGKILDFCIWPDEEFERKDGTPQSR